MKYFTIFITTLFIFVACSSDKKSDSNAPSNTSAYVEEIAKNVQTDKKGTWYDMKFKVIDIKEPLYFTVQDSINYLTEYNYPTALYDNRNKSDVLALVVECKYSIFPPTVGTEVIESYNFTFSPDGKKCIGRRKIK